MGGPTNISRNKKSNAWVFQQKNWPKKTCFLDSQFV